MIGPITRLRARRERRQREDRILLLAVLWPGRRHYAYDLARQTGLSAGRVYPALTRLEQAGEITSGWDDGPYPRRRHYQLPEETR